MSQNTAKGSPEAVGSIKYSPSPSESPLIKIFLQEEPGTEDFEPFFAERKRDQRITYRALSLTWQSAELLYSNKRRFLYTFCIFWYANMAAESWMYFVAFRGETLNYKIAQNAENGCYEWLLTVTSWAPLVSWGYFLAMFLLFAVAIIFGSHDHIW